MQFDESQFGSFREICRKICINIPGGCVWQWDARREMALVTITREDSDVVYFPLLREFQDRWRFSLEQHDSLIVRLLDEAYSLMPGQTFFASPPIGNLVLFVAWWPWGASDNISMRVGLLQLNRDQKVPNLAFALLRRWLPISGGEPAL